MTLPPLYKYLDITGARLTLQNQTFKHSNPSDFTDKEDMTVISAFPDDIKTACIKIQNSIADCLANNVDRQPTCKGQFQDAVRELQALCRQPNGLLILKKVLQEENTESLFDINHLTKFAAAFVDNINEFMQRFRVFCICELVDSIKMWEEYAENHQGIALRVHPNIENDSKFTQLRKVEYRQKRPALFDDIPSFLENALFGNEVETTKIIMDKIIYTKTLKYEHEKEYRLAIPILDGEPVWNIQKYHSNEISELYLGAKMTQEFKKEITRLAQTVNPNIKILHGHLDENGKVVFS